MFALETNTRPVSWNNGKEVPRWGVAETQKMSPSTTGICSRHAAAVLSNMGVGTADQCTVGDDVQPGQMAISGQKPS